MSARRTDRYCIGNRDLEEVSSSRNDDGLASTSSAPKRKVDDEDDEAAHSAEYLRRKHKFIKSTIRTDYQPDICKDYKETGFCGFGDSCKFLHDRSDYKHGWQLEQEWAKGEYEDEADDKYLIREGDSDDDDGIPHECPICREPFSDPVVTKCQHYFCSKCAEKDCTDKCFACEKPTSGIFKNASKVVNPRPSRSSAPVDGAKPDSSVAEDEAGGSKRAEFQENRDRDSDESDGIAQEDNNDNDEDGGDKSDNEYDHYEW